MRSPISITPVLDIGPDGNTAQEHELYHRQLNSPKCRSSRDRYAPSTLDEALSAPGAVSGDRYASLLTAELTIELVTWSSQPGEGSLPENDSSIVALVACARLGLTDYFCGPSDTPTPANVGAET